MEDSVRDRFISKISLLRRQLDACVVTILTADNLLSGEWGTKTAREDVDLLRQQLSVLTRYADRLERKQIHLQETLQSLEV